VRVTEPPEATNTALLLMMLGRRIREQAETALRAEGLSMRQLSVLGHLAHQPGLSYSELARRDGITVQSMQSTLLQLEKAGAVQRLTAPGRGRTADLQVTAEGRKLLDRGRRVLRAADQQLEKAIGAEASGQMATAAMKALIALKE
jgi:DNA-binding MarR family transcriptional regulator